MPAPGTLRSGSPRLGPTLPAGSVSFAHDLRNILSSVRGYAQLLLSIAHEEKIVEHLAIMEAESSRCCELLERMLRPGEPAGAPTSPRRPDDTTPFNRDVQDAQDRKRQASCLSCPSLFKAVVVPTGKSDAARAAERVCNLARGEAALKGVDLAWKVEGEPSPAAIAQEDIEEVLLNLVRNGIQATPCGGRVDVRARSCRLDGGAPGVQSAAGNPKRGGAGRKRPGVEIEVSDTGRGVPEYARKTIFEPFFSTHNSGEGVGLGLAICSALVGRCGGSIDVRSEEGAGTTLTVRLPAGEQGG